jgi:iron-sulfur cluster repair protein YtfE (RIC family)
MVVEIVYFHSAMRLEITALVTALRDIINNMKLQQPCVVHSCLEKGAVGPCTARAGVPPEESSSSSSGEINCLKDDFNSFMIVLNSHSDSEDALIFPVLVARAEAAMKEKLAYFDGEHNSISSLLNVIKSQWSVYPLVHSESARICILEDILVHAVALREAVFTHLDNEEEIMHGLMMDHMTKDEVNVIVGRVMGHRSSDDMQKILTLMYRHLSKEEFDICMKSINQSVSGTFFESWLATLPPRTSYVVDTASVVSSMMETSIGDPEENILQYNVTVANVMTGAIPGELREVAIDHIRKDYESNAPFSLEHVIQKENSRLLSQKKKRLKRPTNLSELSSENAKKRPNTALAAPVAAAAAPSTIDKVILSADDMTTCFFNEEEKTLGCPHYRRNCKIVAPCCSRVFGCRLCHNDSVADGHVTDRFVLVFVYFYLYIAFFLISNPICWILLYIVTDTV